MADLRWERTRGGKHPEYVLRNYARVVPPKGLRTFPVGTMVGGVRMTSRKRDKWRVWENHNQWFPADTDYFHAYITAKTPEEAMNIAIVMLQAYVK